MFQEYYTEALQASPSAVSWIGSIQVFLLFFLSSMAGRAVDGGFFTATYRIGSLLVVVGLAVASLGTRYWHILVAQGLLCGLGSGLIFCPSVALCSTYFQRHRSLAIGLGASGSSTGGIIIPLMVQRLLPRIGFAWTARALALVCLVLLTVANAIMKPRLRPRKIEFRTLVEPAAFREAPYTLLALGLPPFPPSHRMEGRMLIGAGTFLVRSSAT